MVHRTVIHGDGDGLVWLDVKRLVKSTDKAKLVVLAQTDEEKWVPKSVIEDENDEMIGVQKWWAEKNDLESDW